MRKNTARHWLHAGLDLLPLILIPVFMIYSHRHTIDSGSIEVPQNEVVNFNQYLILDTTNDTFVETSQNDNTKTNSYTLTQNAYNFQISGDWQYSMAKEFPITTNFKLTNNHQIYFRFYNFDNGITFHIWGNNNALNVDESKESFIFNSGEFTNYRVYFQIKDTFIGTFNYNCYLNMFDLTQMFGEGNEPTIQQFNEWYPNGYYDYVLNHKELLKGVSTITYDDTDIMSQFTYQLYNSVDKYFNMGNVFGISNVYDWFVLNIFGGNASISIYIVWNIVLYEFVMDLLFLLYALFMWFIDMTKRLIEKPLDSIK